MRSALKRWCSRQKIPENRGIDPQSPTSRHASSAASGSSPSRSNVMATRARATWNDRDHDAGVSGAAAATRGATMGLHAGSGPRCLHSHRTTGAHRQPGLMGRHARRCACRTRTLRFRASAHLGAARQRRFLRPRLTPVCPRSACGWHRSDAAGRLSLASAAHGCEPPLAPFCCLLL